jgi:nucleoside-diphosphate-sugar epimerase
MAILVTGATGYLGAEVVRALLQRAERSVFVLVRSEEKGRRLLEWCKADRDRLKPVNADLGGLMRLPPDTDTIIHAAAVRTESHPNEATRANVEGTNHLLDLAVREGVRRWIQASTQSVYGWEGAPWSERAVPNPRGAYALTKYEGEGSVVARKEKLDYVILRIARICGASLYARGNELFPKWVGQACQGMELTISGDGRQRMDFIHVADVTRCIETLVDLHPEGWNETYNVGSGSSVSLNEVVEELSSLLKERGLPRVKVAYKNQGSGDGPSHLELDTTRLRSKTGWNPRHGIRDVLREYLDGFLPQPANGGIAG